MQSVIEAPARPQQRELRSLEIQLAAGSGEGPTPLAAFDAALGAAGIANYNLLCLSSVIPPRARVVQGGYKTPPHHYGQRLYVVMSQMRETRLGRSAYAGIGWVQEEHSGCGLFVELHGENHAQLEHELHLTLDAMTKRRDMAYGPVQTQIVSRRCEGRPVCALVVAVYASEPW